MLLKGNRDDDWQYYWQDHDNCSWTYKNIEIHPSHFTKVKWTQVRKLDKENLETNPISQINIGKFLK